ncbi:MAG: metallophosphoesterase [Lentisphaerae bacterium]|nr:metallophosphoesterase [Lentisphaerota bacterium]MCP4102214.1 metallophosphoesterase [Lentisphaerota bacterium]
MGVYLFSDIHGNMQAYKTIKNYLKRELKKNDQVICVGDLIDRGPQSVSILIDYAKMMRFDPRYHFVFGNHEWILAKVLAANKSLKHWYKCGGITLLKELYGKGNYKLYQEFFVEKVTACLEFVFLAVRLILIFTERGEFDRVISTVNSA